MLKQLFVNRSSLDIYTSVFLGEIVRTAAKTMVVDRKYGKVLGLICLKSEPLPNAANSSDVRRVDSMLRELRQLLCYDKHGCFSCEDVLGPLQKPWLWTEKKKRKQGALSLAGFAADNKDEVLEGKFVT